MSEFKNYREESRTNWGRSNGEVTREDLQFGCLLRIADALERIASLDLVSKLQNAENDVKYYKERVRELGHKQRGLKGAITRMKGGKK